MIEDHVGLAIIVEYDPDTCTPIITSYAPLHSDSPSSVSSSQASFAYLSACDLSHASYPTSDPYSTKPASQHPSNNRFESSNHRPPQSNTRHTSSNIPTASTYTTVKRPGVQTKKKYKPVAIKVKPISADLPKKYRIERNIVGDPLKEMPTLDPNSPAFQPTGRYTQERKEKMDKIHPEGFLQPAERHLMHDFVCKQNQGFAWDDSERGRFREDFFPSIDIPTVPHTPWTEKNIPIPPGIYDEVCAIIKTKIAAGVYEPSNSSYRSRWFCVLKKDGKSLRIVHSLEPLNKVTIRHSGVTPIPDHLAEQFAGRSCGAMLDLYVGYDERLLAESSRDYTTFQTPYGSHRLVTLPMGWTNSVPIFHDDVTHILQPEIPHVTIPYIDDVPLKGPPTRYVQADGTYEAIVENPGIRRFVWEHFQNLNRVVQRMKYCGGTFSGTKIALCVPEIIVLGHRCTFEGRLPDESKVVAIKKWGPCITLSEIRAFLGTVGVLRIFIRNFAHRAHHLVKLTRKDIPFEWGLQQLLAQEDLKHAVLTSPALRPLDYKSEAPVILAVDTSYIAVGFHLCQCDSLKPRIRYYNRFGSITLNEREARFSQPKLEIYGLYRSLRSLRLFLIGLRNIVVEVDARYIKGMLNNPDILPSASINRWIVAILTFHFKLVHVPGTSHGPDGLSRRPRQPDDDPEEPDDFDDWIDRLYGFMHQINNPYVPRRSTVLVLALTNVFAGAQISNLEKETIVDTPVSDPEIEDLYPNIPRKDTAIAEDERLIDLRQWLTTLRRPSQMSDSTFVIFARYATEFFVDGDRLWKKDRQGKHKLVVDRATRWKILVGVHDDVGHKGFYATRAMILDRFWWPGLQADVHWFVQSCQPCQERQLRHILIPPTVAMPAPLFSKVYMDTMQLAPSGGYKYIVQGRCSISTWPEFRKLRAETAITLGEWIFEDILCRWGALSEIVTDNAKAFIKAVDYLAKKYHIHHIRISGYNSRANGLVERTHFDVRQSLYKVAKGVQSKWSSGTHLVFWAERITTRRRMGCSPFYAATGTYPLIPLDISEATYLQLPPTSTLSTTDLITRRAIDLQKRHSDLETLHSKVYKARLDAAKRFEKTHATTIRDFDFKKGDLVLVRNTKVKKSLNHKMRPRYNGPLIVIGRNYGGAYIICELDGTVFDSPIAAFRVVPYFARKSIPLPDNLLDISTARLREMETSTFSDEDENIFDEEYVDPEEE